MRSAAVLCMSFIASALAYRVTTPSAAQGWTNVGPQKLTWERVDTDSLNFTAFLTNQADVNQVLSALVDGKLLTMSLNPPSAGWPTGKNFRLNLVKSPDELSTIYAQSSEFEIKAPTTNTTSGTTLIPGTTSTITPVNTPATADTGSSPTDTSNTPGSNAALPAISIQSGLLLPIIIALLGLALA